MNPSSACMLGFSLGVLLMTFLFCVCVFGKMAPKGNTK